METENPKFSIIKNTIMNQLQQNSHESLQVIIVNDSLKEVFMNRSSGMTGLPFSALKLVVIRWEGLNQLIEMERQWATKDCTGTRHYIQSGSHHHSPWKHLADEYSYFYKCDCVLLENTRDYHRRKYIPDSFWEKVVTRVLDRVWLHERQTPALRYFIVGNQESGYQGIERDSTVPFMINPRLGEMWSYNVIKGTECKRILDERFNGLQRCS